MPAYPSMRLSAYPCEQIPSPPIKNTNRNPSKRKNIVGYRRVYYLCYSNFRNL